MEFYTVDKKSNINLNQIEYSLLEWKILNIVTYINSLIYKDDNLISFYFEINEVLYNFNIVYNYDKWVLHFDENINESDATQTIILNMVDMINNEMDTLPKTRLPNQLLDMIEIKIEETDFD